MMDILRTSIKTSLVVGTVLTMINHGTNISNGHLDLNRIVQIFLCYLIPLFVALFSQFQMHHRLSDQLDKKSKENICSKSKEGFNKCGDGMSVKQKHKPKKI